MTLLLHIIYTIFKKFVFNFMLFIRFLVLGKFKQYHGLDFSKTSKLNVLHSFASVCSARIQQKNKSIGHKTLHLQMIKIERQEPVTKQTNEWTNMKKTHSNKATTNLWLCAWQRKNKNAKSRNKQTIEKKTHTHKQIGIWQFNGNLSTVIEQNSHKMVKFISMETGSRTPLSAAH